MSSAVTETADSNLPTELLSPAQLSHLRLLEAESIHNPHEKAAEFEGPVTAGEREARWGHRGGVLELSGPAHIVNAVDRALIKAQVAAGLVVLLVRTNQSDTLIARVDNQQVKFDAAEPMPAITGVYQLLHRAEIFISSERAGL